MALITVRDVTIAFRGPPLLDDVSCQFEPGQRVALLGRNGAGKTTLLRMLSGQIQPDHGSVSLAPGVRIALLPQDVPGELHGSVREVVASGVSVDHAHPETAWQGEQQIDRILVEMQLPADARFETLSAG